MRFIFICGHAWIHADPLPLQLPGPALRGSGPPCPKSRTTTASAAPASLHNPAPQALPGGVPTPCSPEGFGSARPGTGAALETPASRPPNARPRPARKRPGGRERAGRRGPARGARRPQKCGLPPPPAATPPPAPTACARVSVCLSSISTSVGISSQEVRE